MLAARFVGARARQLTGRGISFIHYLQESRKSRVYIVWNTHYFKICIVIFTYFYHFFMNITQRRATFVRTKGDSKRGSGKSSWPSSPRPSRSGAAAAAPPLSRPALPAPGIATYSQSDGQWADRVLKLLRILPGRGASCGVILIYLSVSELGHHRKDDNSRMLMPSLRGLLFIDWVFIQYVGSAVPRFLAPHLLGTEATYGLRTRTSLST